MRFARRVLNARLLAPSKLGLAMLSVLPALGVVMLFGVMVTAASEGGPAIRVTITADGQTWDYVSCRETVGGILTEAGVALGEKDRVYPKLNAKSTQGLHIRVTRLVDKVVLQVEPVKFKRVAKFYPYGVGRKVIQQGQTGEKEVRYLVTYKDGVKSACKILGSRATKQPVSEIVAVSRAAMLASRAGSYVRSFRMVATAYEPYNCGGSGSGRTASGMHAGRGVVAVDPRVIRLGTKLYVEGYGFCIAGDTGGAIKGNRIDLGFDTYGEAIRFGRRWVTVYILE